MGNEQHKRELIEDFKSSGERSEIAQYVKGKKLNLGCGVAKEPEWNDWDNADFNPRAEPNLLFDVRDHDWMWTAKPGSYDTVYARMFLHLFRDEMLFQVMFNIYGLLKPGGHLVAEVPYGVTGNPLQQSYWTEATPMFFNREIYFKREHSATLEDQMMPLRDWNVVLVAQRQGEGRLVQSIVFVMQRPV